MKIPCFKEIKIPCFLVLCELFFTMQERFCVRLCKKLQFMNTNWLPFPYMSGSNKKSGMMLYEIIIKSICSEITWLLKHFVSLWNLLKILQNLRSKLETARNTKSGNLRSKLCSKANLDLSLPVKSWKNPLLVSSRF